MKKITSKALLAGLALLSYQKNAFAQWSAAPDTGGLPASPEPSSTSIFLSYANWAILLLFLPLTIAMLFFYGGYFYLRNKKDNVKIEKSKKYLRRAKWFLVADAVLVVSLILLNWLDKSLSTY